MVQSKISLQLHHELLWGQRVFNNSSNSPSLLLLLLLARQATTNKTNFLHSWNATWKNHSLLLYTPLQCWRELIEIQQFSFVCCAMTKSGIHTIMHAYYDQNFATKSEQFMETSQNYYHHHHPHQLTLSFVELKLKKLLPHPFIIAQYEGKVGRIFSFI